MKHYFSFIIKKFIFIMICANVLPIHATFINNEIIISDTSETLIQNQLHQDTTYLLAQVVSSTDQEPLDMIENDSDLELEDELDSNLTDDELDSNLTDEDELDSNLTDEDELDSNLNDDDDETQGTYLDINLEKLEQLEKQPGTMMHRQAFQENVKEFSNPKSQGSNAAFRRDEDPSQRMNAAFIRNRQDNLIPKESMQEISDDRKQANKKAKNNLLEIRDTQQRP